jgi:hypothetical protein
LDCADTPNAVESTWVGTGGASSGDLLQTGVVDECVNGAQGDVGWWEKYPSVPNYGVGFEYLPVAPGDSIEASVYQNTAGQWVTRLDNLTTHLSGWMITGEAYGVGTDASGTFADQGSTTDLTYSGGYTAEWIVEDPSTGSALAPFVNYTTVTFSNLAMSLSSWDLSSDEGWEIVQDGTVLSTPSLPGNDEFSVSYTGP